MLLGALIEAALQLARAEDQEAAKERTGEALRALLEGLRALRAARPPPGPGWTGSLEFMEMKTEIHPQYGLAHVHCSCGNEFYTRSTQSEIRVEICSACHPFYTGKQKLVDTGGRVERFKRRQAKSRAELALA